MKINCISAAILFSLVSSQCLAMAPAPSPVYDATASNTTRNDTRLYTGLSWTLGVKMVIEAMIGVRVARVDSSGKVTGSSVGASVPLDNFNLAKARATYIHGTTNAQAEAGFGYAFGPGKPLGTFRYNIPYFYAGSDYVLDNGFEPFAGLKTAGKIDQPNPTYSCTGAPATLVGTTCQPVPVF